MTLRCPRLSLALFLASMAANASDDLSLPPTLPFHQTESLSFLKTGDPLVDWNSSRQWTSREGRSMSAKILRLAEGQASFALENGSSVTLPLERFSEEDQRFIREWEAVSTLFNLGYEAPRRPPKSIDAGIFDGAFAKEGKVHETSHFRFECDAPLSGEVVKEFSRLFEVTYLGVLANPLGLALAEPEGGKFRIRLFSRDADYLAAGGTTDSAGVYLIKDRLMLVPLSSLGLTLGSTGYKKTRDFDPRTLIHETTHALMHQWLSSAPMWFIEGFAEYMAAIPYREGRLDFSRHREGMYDLIAKKCGGNPARFSLSPPQSFAKLGHHAFMGELEPVEKLVHLPQLSPFQITLVSKATAEAEAATVAATQTTSTSLMKPRPLQSLPTDSETDSSEVLRRYISSMVLLDHLIHSGQVDTLRAYLFDFAHFEWDRALYLKQFIAAHKAHHSAVSAQIAAFDAKVDRFNSAALTYNDTLAQYRAGQIDNPPTAPNEPVVPDALPLPEILKSPRSPEALSRQDFREHAWERHFPHPVAFSIPSSE